MKKKLWGWGFENLKVDHGIESTVFVNLLSP